MVAKTIELKEASKVEITSLIDNSVDFLSSINRKEAQSYRQWNKMHTELPIAEHGFSMLIKVYDDYGVYVILFDTGISQNGVVSNAKRMGINLHDVSYIVLSHGHYDHFGGLANAVEAINRNDLIIIGHEDMIKRRGTANSKEEIKEYPSFPIDDKKIIQKILNIKKPLLIASNLACVTGEIPRTVEFERGIKQNRIFKDGSWQPDQLILDDRALVFKIKDKGLVVISGCAHAGIINTLKYAQEITKINKVYAIFGGFHLAGKGFEETISPTIEELKKLNPELIAPSHCTGWRALCTIAKDFPTSFINSSVGNLYELKPQN